jgi:co-chaperonin GroES (HSP10)
MQPLRNQAIVRPRNDRVATGSIELQRGLTDYAVTGIPNTPGFVEILSVGPGVASEHKPDVKAGDVCFLDLSRINIETSIDGQRVWFVNMAGLIARWNDPSEPPVPLNNYVLTEIADEDTRRHLGTRLILPSQKQSSDRTGYLKHQFERVLAVGEGRVVRKAFNAIPQSLVGGLLLFSALRALEVHFNGTRGHLIPFEDAYAVEPSAATEADAAPVSRAAE